MLFRIYARRVKKRTIYTRDRGFRQSIENIKRRYTKRDQFTDN